MADATYHPRDRLLAVVESLALFVLGVALMTFFYHAATNLPSDEIGAPGHDDFYHVKMAAMLPQVGLLSKFPWLQYAYFRDHGDAFVSHHYGFHVLLMPFVQLSYVLTGDYLAGGRWAIAAFFGLNLVLFNLLLRAGGVRYRWLWLVLFLFMPDQFFTRHAFIRAIGPSLVFMQLVLLWLFRARYFWASLAIAGYIHLYLGAVLYIPVVVGLYALAMIIGPRAERCLPWRMAAWTAAGWVLGVLTYPYFSGMLEFLRVQVTGSGLSPDVAVGREWKPYTDVWWFTSMSATLLVIWIVALSVRLRLGPHLSARELGLLLINFAFLVLTAKARRFIEYWPPLCLLSAAYLSNPVVAAVSNRLNELLQRERLRPLYWGVVALGVGVAVLLALLWHAAAQPEARLLLAEWRVWAAVLALLLLAPLTGLWLDGVTRETPRSSTPRHVAIVASGVLIAACVGLAAHLGQGASLPPARLRASSVLWPAVAVLYVLVPLAARAVRQARERAALPRTATRVAAVLLVGLGLFGGAVALGARHLTGIAKQTRGYFDLPAVRKLMAFVKEHSRPGDIIFTDDWDVFPVFFYHNSHNSYIVGLDPQFTHERRPDLWERYVKITRGEVPAKSVVRLASDDGRRQRHTLDIDLHDIRDEFRARFVITDRDHQKLASKLAHDEELAELIYPARVYTQCRDAPYLVFRIRAPGEAVTLAAARAPDANGNLYLGVLKPSAADQGWGQLTVDATVENRRLKLRGTPYLHGLGTHAPSKLLYDVPPGYEYFEAVVGIDDETDGRGSAVASVYLDGTRVFESPVLTGDSEPAVVRIALRGARQILLGADPTPDGQRFDHVNWADARFVQSRDETAAGIGARVAGAPSSAGAE